MKITKSNLMAALSSVEPIAKTRSTLPILSCVLMSAKNCKLSLRASDLDCDIEATADCVGNLDPCCVRASMMSKIVSSGISDVDIEPEKTKLIIKSGGTAKVSFIPGEEFPPAPKSGKELNCDCMELANGIELAKVSVSEDPSRYVLNGVHVVLGDKLKVESTDGRRLTQYTIEKECGPADFIIGSQFIPYVISALRKPGSRLLLSDNMMHVRHDAGLLSCKLLEGTYPNTDQVIPKDDNLIGHVNSQQLLKATECCQSVFDDRVHQVKYTFGDGIQIDYKSQDDEYHTQVGGKFSLLIVGLDMFYVEQAMRIFGDQQVEVRGKDDISAVTFSAGNLFAVIMPMRLV